MEAPAAEAALQPAEAEAALQPAEAAEAPRKRARNEGNESKPRRLFHVVFSCPKDKEAMRTPESVGKANFGKMIEEILAKHWEARNNNKLLRLSVFEEVHSSGEKHFHSPVLADKPFVAGPLEKGLREQRIYVYIETSHEFYWSLMCYLSIPRAEKPQIDSQPYLSSGHPSIMSCLQDIPRGASRGEKDRCLAYLGKKGPGKGTASRCMAHNEFGRWLVEKGLKTKVDLLAFLQKHRDDPTSKAAEDYCFRYSQHLANKIAFAWEFANAPKAAATMQCSAWDMVERAKDAPCVCSGRFGELLDSNLTYQCSNFPSFLSENEKPNPHAFRASMVKALKEGARKLNNVFLYGPRNSGKSSALSALEAIFKDMCFSRPVGKSNYIMSNVIGKKVCVLQDMRVGTLKLSWDSMLVFFEGAPVTVPMPRNIAAEDVLYTGAAPIFVSASEKFRISMEMCVREGVTDVDRQNAMMDSRFQFYCFPQSRPHSELVFCAPCPSCMSLWLQAGA